MKTHHYLYDGKVELLFDSTKHQYMLDGNLIPSVTKITGMIDKSGPLMWYSSRCAVDYVREHLTPGVALDEIQINAMLEQAYKAHMHASRKAADIGTLAHSYAQDYSRGLSPDLPVNEQAQRGALAFKAWFDAADVEVIQPEKVIYSAEHDYAGTCDLLCEMDGRHTIVEYKTTTNGAVYPEWHLQVAAYQRAIAEELGYVCQVKVVTLNKDDAGFAVHDLPDEEIHRNFHAFLGAQRVYNRLQEMKK